MTSLITTSQYFSVAAMERARSPILESNLRRLARAVAGPVAPSASEPLQTVDFSTFDWSDSGRSRNWWWAVQQLPTLAWSTGNLAQLPSHKDRALRELNASVITTWAIACRSPESRVPLAWHDHASALRAINLFRWLCTLVAAGCEDEQTELLSELVDEHVEWLADDRNFSRGTNHGFEQAWVLLEIAIDSCDRYAGLDLVSLAKNRLIKEIQGSFSKQGVHKENSPGYHFFMIQRLRQLQDFLDTRGAELGSVNVGLLIEAANEFLAAVALPDFSLPLIGDTLINPQQTTYIRRTSRNSRSRETEQVFDYTASGYLIWRASESKQCPSLHLIFKNAHDSSYHRHDDDLMIHLAVSGKVVFGDSGLFSYDEKSPARKFVRSAHAHSTVYPVEFQMPPRKPELLSRRPVIEFDARQRVVKGTTYVYDGLVISRRCTFVGRLGRILKLTDCVSSHLDFDQEVHTAFIVPMEFDCHNEGDGSPTVRVSDGNGVHLRLRVQSGPSSRLDILEGWHERPERCSILSSTMGSFVPCRKVVIAWNVPARSKVSLVLTVDAD